MRIAVEFFSHLCPPPAVSVNPAKQYDEYTYNAAIAACSVANNWQKAIELFRAMDRGEIRGARGERSGPGGGRQGIRGRTPRAGTVSYNAAITAYSRALQPKEALALLEEMKDRGVPRDEVGGWGR